MQLTTSASFSSDLDALSHSTVSDGHPEVTLMAKFVKQRVKWHDAGQHHRTLSVPGNFTVPLNGSKFTIRETRPSHAMKRQQPCHHRRFHLAAQRCDGCGVAYGLPNWLGLLDCLSFR